MFGYISHFDGMDTGKIIAHVTEGKVNRVSVVYMDDEGNPKKGGGETDPDVVLRELPFKVRSPPPLGAAGTSSRLARAQAQRLGFGRVSELQQAGMAERSFGIA